MKEETRKRLQRVEEMKEALRKHSKEHLVELALSGGMLWDYVSDYDICMDDYRIIDKFYITDEYVYCDRENAFLLKELYDYSEDEGWVKKVKA
jgi:hypothetical protein